MTWSEDVFFKSERGVLKMNRSRNQWITLSAVLFIALLARISVADTVKTKTTTKTVTETSGPAKLAPVHKGKGKKTSRTTASNTTEDTYHSRGSFPIDLSVGPDLLIIPGGAGFGVTAHAVTPITRTLPILVGVETGIDFGAGGGVSNNIFGTTGVTGGGATVIHLLATGIYRIDIASAPKIHPYVGLSMGPAFAFGSDVMFRNTTIAQGRTSVQFEALLRPGVAFDLSQKVSLLVEPKIGIFGGDFMFKPVVAASFAL